MMPTTRSDLPGRFLESVLPDERIRAMWLEGRDRLTAWSDEGGLDLHVAVEDPDFDAVWGSHDRWLAGVVDVLTHEDAPAPVDGQACVATLREGGTVVLTVERASLLAKRLRTFVVPLLDRSGRLRFVLSYRRPWEGRAPRGGEVEEPPPPRAGSSSGPASPGPHLVPPKRPETTTPQDLPGPKRRPPAGRSSPASGVPAPAMDPLPVPGELPPAAPLVRGAPAPGEARGRSRSERSFLVEPPPRTRSKSGRTSPRRSGDHRLEVQWFEEDASSGEPVACEARIVWKGEGTPCRVTVEKGGETIVEGAQSSDLELARKFCVHRYGAPPSGWREA